MPKSAKMASGRPVPTPAWEFGDQALRTRASILDNARQIFLERGFGGTRVEHISAAAGISRASFYTYFSSKLEVFDELGSSTYRHISQVITELEELPRPLDSPGLGAWVATYFEFLDAEGAFMLASSQTGPTDPDFRKRVLELHAKSATRVGTVISTSPLWTGHSPLAAGVAVIALIERSWFLMQTIAKPGERESVLSAVVQLLTTGVLT